MGATRSRRPADWSPLSGYSEHLTRILHNLLQQINITFLRAAVNLPVSPAPSITLQDGNKQSSAIWLCVKIISFKLLHD